ncbi:unnamed protein product [Ixodes pacificus]
MCRDCRSKQPFFAPPPPSCELAVWNTVPNAKLVCGEWGGDSLFFTPVVARVRKAEKGNGWGSLWSRLRTGDWSHILPHSYPRVRGSLERSKRGWARAESVQTLRWMVVHASETCSSVSFVLLCPFYFCPRFCFSAVFILLPSQHFVHKASANAWLQRGSTSSGTAVGPILLPCQAPPKPKR